MNDTTRLIFGDTAEDTTIRNARRKYRFEELVPTQSQLFRYVLWTAQRKYRKAEIPDIVVLPAARLSEVLHKSISHYPILDGKFYIWDGHHRAKIAKIRGDDGIYGRFVTEEELSRDDMLGTALDQKLSFLYMTAGGLRSIDDMYIERNSLIRDWYRSLKAV